MIGPTEYKTIISKNKGKNMGDESVSRRGNSHCAYAQRDASKTIWLILDY